MISLSELHHSGSEEKQSSNVIEGEQTWRLFSPVELMADEVTLELG